MIPRLLRPAVAVLGIGAFLAGAVPAEACDKVSVTQIAIQGNPANPNQPFTADPVTVTHTIYYCTGEFQCETKEITFTLTTKPGGKTQAQLAQELADHIKACLPEPLKSNVKAVDNVVSIYGTNSCSGTGDPCTPKNPCKQPPKAGKMDLHTSQRTWQY